LDDAERSLRPTEPGLNRPFSSAAEVIVPAIAGSALLA